MTTKKALLLVNPKSRSGGDGKIEACVAKLEAGGLAINVVESQSVEHAIHAMRDRTKRGEIVIIAGGDGTISKLAPTVRELNAILAVLPMGTANDLARSLEIPQDPLAACDLLLEGMIARVDLGTVNGTTFFNAAHLGMGVRITDELSSEIKKKWGVFSYLHAFVKALARLDSFTVYLKIDRKRIRMRALHVGVGNGRYYGGGNVIDQHCFINDGQLSLFVLKPQSFWSLLRMAPLLRTGTQRLAKRTFAVRAKKIEIRTRRPMEIHADGEPVATTPAKFGVIASAIRVICAPGALNLSEKQQQTGVKIMEWLKSEQEVCVNELLIAAQESADFYRDAAQIAEEQPLREKFLQFEATRKAIAKRIERYLESQGELTVMPDPDAEWGAKMLKHLAVKLSSDEDATLIEQRLDGEEDIAKLIKAAGEIDLDTNFQALLRDYSQHNDWVVSDLKKMLKQHTLDADS